MLSAFRQAMEDVLQTGRASSQLLLEMTTVMAYGDLIDAFEQNINHLLRQTETTIGFLTDTLNFSKQHVEKEQLETFLQLSVSTADDAATVRVLTVVTMVYVSFTSIAVSWFWDI